VPQPSLTVERRAKIRGRAQSDSLPRDQEAGRIKVVARARNYFQANGQFSLRFEISV